MTLFLTDDDVRATFDWPSAIAALRDAYSAPVNEASFPARTMARGDGTWLRTLSGVAPDGEIMGAKLIAASTRSGYAAYLIPLFDQHSVELVALLDGNAITGFRTAATSALAIDALAPQARVSVSVIGSGFEATSHARAVAAVRDVSSITVYSPNPASRARYVERLQDLGVSIRAAERPDAAVAGTDVVICAARSRDETPTFCGAWLRAGMTVVSIGSTLPEQRELDPAAIDAADLIVADVMAEVTDQTGDMITARQAQVPFDGKMVALGDVLAGRRPGRRSASDVVLYKSVGSALQDLAVASLCFRRAVEQALGTTLPVSVARVAK